MEKRNNVCVCCKMAIDTYVGGICTIINSYFDNLSTFYKNGYNLSLFNYCAKKTFKNSKVDNIYYAIHQKKALLKYFENNDISILHIHTSREFLFLKDVALGKKIKKKTGAKIVLTIHVGDINTVFNRIPSFLKKKLIKDCNKYFDKVIFLTEAIRNQFIKSGLSEEITSVLYNFYDFGSSCKESNLPAISNKNYLELTFIGMINRDKGIVELLSAISILKGKLNLKLNVCGTVTDKSIENDYNSLLVKNSDVVIAHGYVGKDDKFKILSRSDLLVLPSYHEGFPLVILEALATKCGIVCTPVGAIPEVLDETNYISIEPKSVSSICDAITCLYNDSNKLNAMKDSNALKSLDFTIDEHINKLCLIYDTIAIV